MERFVTDERTGLKYELVGDYYLIAGEDEPEEDRPIGVWGQRHLRYLKEHHRGRYANLLANIETAFEGKTGALEGCSSLSTPAPPEQ